MIYQKLLHVCVQIVQIMCLYNYKLHTPHSFIIFFVTCKCLFMLARRFLDGIKVSALYAIAFYCYRMNYHVDVHVNLEKQRLQPLAPRFFFAMRCVIFFTGQKRLSMAEGLQYQSLLSINI